MGRQSRPYLMLHRRFDRAFLTIHGDAIASDEKQLLFGALPSDIAPLEVAEQRLAYRELPTVAFTHSRAKNSVRAKAHRRGRESYAKRARFQLGVGGLTCHLLEEHRSEPGKPRMAPELIDADLKLKWNSAELISRIREPRPDKPAFSNRCAPESE